MSNNNYAAREKEKKHNKNLSAVFFSSTFRLFFVNFSSPFVASLTPSILRFYKFVYSILFLRSSWEFFKFQLLCGFQFVIKSFKEKFQSKNFMNKKIK